MRYLGGKARQSKAVESVVLEMRGDRRRYIEPFVGGGSVFARIAPYFEDPIASDSVPELIALWKAVAAGWEPPAEMGREEWAALRDDPRPSALKGWAAYACSYNGKYFAGYGPTACGRDYLAESRRAILRKAPAFADARIDCCDYAAHTVDGETVVYCDPPYASTEQYGAVSGFDHARFWATAEAWAGRGAVVLVHEYTAPPGWGTVHEAARVETMHHGGPSSGARMERLYVRS